MTNHADLRIIVAPLDWGMGHATRCIPVIRMLQQLGVTVIVGGTKKTHQRILNSGIEADWLKLPSYSMRYSRIFPVWTMVLWKSRLIRKAISDENKSIQSYLVNNRVDAIISDNRYGCYNENVYSVMITHQIRPKAPFLILQPLVNMISKLWLKNFDETWVPDRVENGGLAGELAVPFENKVAKHIGFLSRFKSAVSFPVAGGNVLAIISGPSPQSELFEETLVRIAIQRGFPLTIITAQPDLNSKRIVNERIKFEILPDDARFQTLVAEHQYIVMRSGYSGIMDLVSLNRSALLVPTPGQTEQEYLAKRMIEFGFTSISQKNLSTITLEKSFPALPTLSFETEDGLLKAAIVSMLEKLV